MLGFNLAIAEQSVVSKPLASQNNLPSTKYERIISLDLCVDWLLTYYADSSQVQALSPLQQRFPLPVNNHTWPVHDGSLEQIVSLHPDLVLVGEFNALMLRSRLQRLGYQVEVLPLPRSLKEVQAYLDSFLSLIDVPDALSGKGRSWLVLEEPVAGPRLLLLGANGVGTGQQTFEDQILTQAGWQNYVTAIGYVRMDLEQLAMDPPDAILWSAPESAALANQFAQHPVLSLQIPESAWLTTDYWRWQCPGPWTYELIEQLTSLREGLE